jgi:hypothetical protein
LDQPRGFSTVCRFLRHCESLDKASNVSLVL